ncbi:Aste57867_23167 [Aphanomyces stellatus]|uniref:Aste57867_23167 protein n=1 Tax=Aphanomyces stellatus TaxID=120398 RepID=A0A485LMU5_9STRA|nr:hypothetical protein As57867_023096 [Aphanomyces stellatus]VFT99815.1 Aste57867_23167 [Aphanomyces stellatus]
MDDDDHFRKAQVNLAENTKKAANGLDRAVKENSKWLAALCCSISLEIRRPQVNAKKRRLDLDLLEKPHELITKPDKRHKSIEEKLEPTEPQEVPEVERLPPAKPTEIIEPAIDSTENTDDSDEDGAINPFELKVTELKEELRERGLKTGGLKATLIARLLQAVDEERKIKSSKQKSKPSEATRADAKREPSKDEIVNESDVSMQDDGDDAADNIQRQESQSLDESSEVETQPQGSQRQISQKSPLKVANALEEETKDPIVEPRRSSRSKGSFSSYRSSAESVKWEGPKLKGKKAKKKSTTADVIDLVSPQKAIPNNSVDLTSPDVSESKSQSKSRSSGSTSPPKNVVTLKHSPQNPSSTNNLLSPPRNLPSDLKHSNDKSPEMSLPSPRKSMESPPRNEESFSDSPPQSKKRKDSTASATAPSPPKKTIKAVALFDSTVSPYLPPKKNPPAPKLRSNTSSISSKASFTGSESTNVSPLAVGATLSKPKVPLFDADISPIQSPDAEKDSVLHPYERTGAKETNVPKAMPTKIVDSAFVSSPPREQIQEELETKRPVQSTGERLRTTPSTPPPKADEEGVSVVESDLLMSTAASLFASATSPIMKGYASLKSAFGLSKAKTVFNDDIYSRTTPTPKVPAPKVFQSKSFTSSKDTIALSTPRSTTKDENIDALRASLARAKAMVEDKRVKQPLFQSPVASIPDPKSPAKIRRDVDEMSTPSMGADSADWAQQEIELESKRLRLAAKQSAKKRIEEEKDKTKTKVQLPTISDSAEKPKADNQETIIVADKANQRKSSTPSVIVAKKPTDEVETEAIPAIASSVPKKPLNLVSGLHSFTSLVEKDSSQQSSQNSNSSRGAGPTVVASLKLAERNRLAEQKRALEKKKKREALLKKYEEQRKLDDEKRKKAMAQTTKEHNEKAFKELRQKREREAEEKKQREAELAKKRQNRLQDMQANDEKKRQMIKEKEQAVKEKVEKMRHEREHEKKPVAKPEFSSKPTAKMVDEGMSKSVKPMETKPTKPAVVQNKEKIPLVTANREPEVAVLVKKAMSKSQEFVQQIAQSKKELTNYEMSDGPESDESGNSDDEQKKIPDWAQREALDRALARQFGPEAVDPTPSIFPDFVDSCDLEAIFQPVDPKKKKRFNKRTSSGNWLADRPTMREKVAYKRDMGFIN